ncbi:MAG: hypothetical protein CVT81_10220 [Alphaproteobacteria bacterium HGW-Alphaproteobacteria-3]|nr:MAG: hypothetical protein CVT81_10220 [Alphaproteobacteria bacterium HGW-Alphaproteobacteria-3]
MQEREMKKSMNVLAAATFALAFVAGAPAAWAGSVASVDQSGDSNYTIVVQKKNNTLTRSWTAATPFEARKSQKKIDNIAKLVTKPGQAKSGKPGGGGRGCGFGGGANSANVAQAGYGNTAVLTQTGSNNAAGIYQDGSGNASYIVQKGSGNEAYTTQTGSGNVALIVQRC